MIIDAYSRGLLSREECTKILGIDPRILIDNNDDGMGNLYGFERSTR